MRSHQVPPQQHTHHAPPTTPVTPATPACEFQLSSDVFPDATRGKRGCKVCLFEGRPKTMKTNYCRMHNVCVCSQRFPIPTDPALASIVCPYADWDCWRKYHEYYLPRGLFNKKGRIKRSSELHQARRKLELLEEANSSSPNPAMPTASPPTLVFSPFDGELANSMANTTQEGMSLRESPQEAVLPSPDPSLSASFTLSSPAQFVGTPFSFVSSTSTVYM